MCKGEKCRKKLHTEFPKKKKAKKMKSFQGILCMVRMSEIKKNVPLSDDNVKRKEAVLRL